MTGFESKRSAAQDKLDDDADTLLIVYQRGFADGKRAAQLEQEPVAQITPPGPITQYRIPTQRPWVGLDEDEIRELYGKDLNYRDGNYVRYAKSVEAKLKERNT